MDQTVVDGDDGNVGAAPSTPFFHHSPDTTMTNRETYIAKMKLQLDELDAKMNLLEAKAVDARADAVEKYQLEMAKLRQQSKLAKTRMSELKAAGEDKWDTVVAEMEKVRDAFSHSFNYFKSQL